MKVGIAMPDPSPARSQHGKALLYLVRTRPSSPASVRLLGPATAVQSVYASCAAGERLASITCSNCGCHGTAARVAPGACMLKGKRNAELVPPR